MARTNTNVGGSGGSGTVTQINTSYPVTGGPITTTGTIGLDQPDATYVWYSDNAGNLTGDNMFTRASDLSSLMAGSNVADGQVAYLTEGGNILGLGIPGIGTWTQFMGDTTGFNGAFFADGTGIGAAPYFGATGFVDPQNGIFAAIITNYDPSDSGSADVQINSSNGTNSWQIDVNYINGINFNANGGISYTFPLTSPPSGTVLGETAPNQLGWVSAGLTSVTTDGTTITGDGTSGDPISLILPIQAGTNFNLLQSTLMGVPEIITTDSNGQVLITGFQTPSGSPNGSYGFDSQGNPVISDGGTQAITITGGTTPTVFIGNLDQAFFYVNDSTSTFGFTSPNIDINSIPYVFPNAQGGASTVLTNDGAGNLSWVAGGGGGGGTVTSVATADSITGGTITTSGTLSLVGDNATPGANMVYGTDSMGFKGWQAATSFSLPIHLSTSTLVMQSTTSGSPDLMSTDSNGNLQILGFNTTTMTDSGNVIGFDTSGDPTIGDAGHRFLSLGGVKYDWPASDGSDGYVLQTDGSGDLSWATVTLSLLSLPQYHTIVGDASNDAADGGTSFTFDPAGTRFSIQDGLTPFNGNIFYTDPFVTRIQDTVAQFVPVGSSYSFTNNDGLIVSNLDGVYHLGTGPTAGGMSLDINTSTSVVTLGSTQADHTQIVFNSSNINDSTLAIYSSYNGTSRTFLNEWVRDGSYGRTTIGDVDGNGFGTTWAVDDPSQSYTFNKLNFTIGPVSYVFPSTQATMAGDVLTNDGAGNLSWATAGTQAYTAQTSTYSILSTDYTIDCSGTFTVTLPDATTDLGKIYIIKNSNTGVITVATAGGQTIDGSPTQTVTTSQAVQVQSTGANWIIIN